MTPQQAARYLKTKNKLPQIHRLNTIKKKLICESAAINISFTPQQSCEQFF